MHYAKLLKMRFVLMSKHISNLVLIHQIVNHYIFSATYIRGGPGDPDRPSPPPRSGLNNKREFLKFNAGFFDYRRLI